MMTISDLLTLGGMMAGILGVIQVLIALGDRLWKKKEQAEQPFQCTAQHSSLKDSLTEQVQAIRELAKSMQSMQVSINDAIKADELRYQLMLKELQMITRGQDHIITKLDRASERTQ